MPTVFAISSWGNSGVPWIQDCLNLHPDILVWTCRNHESYSLTSSTLTPVEYVDSMARFGWYQAKVCGDICGLAWDEFPALNETFGDKFRGAVLIAHPVQRLAGSFAFSHEIGRVWKHADFVSMWSMDPSDPRAVIARAVLGEDGDHIPASYMGHVNTIVNFWGPSGLIREPIFKLEDLMTSDAAWAEMITYLSGGEITDFNDTWRRYEGRFSNSAHEPFSVAPRAVWDRFPDYVRRIMAAALTDEARGAFEDLGYDLSFVR